MADREKIIQAMEWCKENACKDCPYDTHNNESCGISDDILDLLKEQEPIEPISYMDGLVQRFACGKCGKHLLYATWGHDNFCSKCGRAVKWDA